MRSFHGFSTAAPIRLGFHRAGHIDRDLNQQAASLMAVVDPARTCGRGRGEALRGRAGAGLGTDEIMALTRGDG